MHRRPSLTILIILTLLLLVPAACGSGQDEDETAAAIGATDTISSANDRTALLAAESILQNAQALQEDYFQVNKSYAATIDDLKTVNPRVNSKLVVVSGTSDGYEMQVTAGDSARTVLILRKSGEVVEHMDSNGNPW